MATVIAPTPVPTPTPTPAPTSLVGTVDPNVKDWYRNTGNRDPDEAGAAFWTDAIGKVGEEKAYADFQKSLQTNEGAYAKPMGLADANRDWTGTQSTAGTSTVDEWAKNVFGRDATADEVQRFGGRTTVDDAQTAYRDFVQAGTAAGGTAKSLDMLEASRFDVPRTRQSVVPASDYGNLQQQYAPNLQREVNAKQETIEGRIGNLAATDANGNYTNPVIRQAVERAQQQFAKRGLVNSSMAAQAGQEAAIAKAIEIAGPDAATYFQQGRANQDAQNVFARDETQQGYTERNNVNSWQNDANLQNQRLVADANLQTQRIVADAQGRHEDQDFRGSLLDREQSFNLRQNYVTAQDRVSQSYQRMVDTINTSQMTPEDKTEALNNAAGIRDTEAAFINNLFAKQPNWSNEWLAMAVQPGTADLSTSTDVNALSTLANDPAQTAAVRQQAQTRLAQLQADPSLVPPKPTPTPAPAGLVDFNGSGN
jgi:hypothetical protein